MFKIIVRRYQGLRKLECNSQTFIISFDILNPLSIVLISIKLFKKKHLEALRKENINKKYQISNNTDGSITKPIRMEDSKLIYSFSFYIIIFQSSNFA